MKVLSLFDGMACGMIAMQLAGVEVESYDAYEIDKYAIKTAQHNFPMIKEHGDVFGADFTKYEGVDFLIGGSPCTYWSIAQTKNRETVASGMGWELFSQYVRALHEAKPKYFIYENNKSMSKDIRASIDEAFGFEAVLINSSLVSAQNRQRLYWVGRRNEDGTYSKVNVEQPADRGILLKDILDSVVARDLTCNDKSYTLTASYDGACAWNTIERHNRNMVAERIPPYGMDKSRPVEANYPSHAGCGEGSLEQRMFSPNPSKQQVDLIAEPVCLRYERTEEAKRCRKAYEAHEFQHGYNELNELHPRPDGKTNTLTSVEKDNRVAEPINDILQVGAMPRPDGEISTSAGFRIYSTEAKGRYLCANGGGAGAKTGLYAVPHDCDLVITENSIRCQRRDKKHSTVQGSHVNFTDGKTQTLSPSHIPNIIEHKSDKKYPVYEVRNGLITIKGKQYPIKLQDGYYIIRKLTVRECMRLQTVPEWYEFPVSDSQAYKMLGNGWTCEVIAHILKSLKEAKQWMLEKNWWS